MALQKGKNTKPATAENQDYKKADAFLNLKVVDSEGNTYTFSRGLPLHLEKRLDRSLINAAKANPELEFKLVGTVYLQDDAEKEDIKF